MSIEAISHIDRIFTPKGPQEVQIMPHSGENSKLEGTGFNPFLEVSRLLKNYSQNLREGKSIQEAWGISVGELEVNIRTFIVEYIQTKTVLPHKNRIEWVNGVKRMVGDNGIPVVDGITDQERQGGVKQASIRVDKYLSGSFDKVAVINSPFGHSGFFKKDGTGITYKNNQTMVFWTDEQGKLQGLTLVTDLDEKQSKKLSEGLGVDENLLTGQTQLERVSNIVRNPALFSYSQALKNPAEYVLDKIIAIRGNSDFKLVQEDGTIEVRSLQQTRADIQRVSELLNFNEDIEDHIKRLKNNLNHPVIQAEIVRAIEETILDITIDYLKQTPGYFGYIQEISASHNHGSSGSQWSNYDNGHFLAAAFLRTRAGCSSSGISSSRSLRGISLGVSSGSIEGSGGVCEHCGMVNDGHYHCPECNGRFEDESGKPQSEWTSSCGCGFTFACAPSEKQSPEESEELSKAV